MEIYEKLSKIQMELKVPKAQFNAFGKYNYRSCEDILESLKPICAKYNSVLFLSDAIRNIGDRYYIEATATLFDFETGKSIQNTGSAREEENKKGQDGSQITGGASSYARKYALNGLFAIDDTKDSDSTNTHGKEPKQASKPYSKPSPSDKTDLEKVIEKLSEKGIAVESLLLKAKVSSLEELSPAQVKKILEM